MEYKLWRGIVLILILVSLMGTTTAEPQGSDLSRGASSRGTNPDPLSTTAQAGNVTQLNIDQTRITDIWQGFYGNVSGQIVLENAAGNNFYDWTYAEITGEVYASRAAITSWSTINCTNKTQWEAEELSLGISGTLIDGINETYNVKSHPAFQVGTRTLNNCQSTRPYNSTNTASMFWNVLLNNDPTHTVYAAIIDDNENAFDDSTADFEILVPVNRTAGFSNYYFYVELN